MRIVLATVLMVGFCSPIFGQVVQLPSVTTFGTTGTVSVPDQGTAYLGGSRSLRSGTISSGFGPMASRAGGSAAGGSSVSVSATVIDLQAMDEALLNRPLPNLPPRSYAPMRQGKPLMNTLTPKNYDRMANRPSRQAATPNDWAIALGSPGDVVPDITSVETKVRYYMGLSAEAYAAGRVAAAKVYYRMAMDQMTPDQQQRYAKIQERNAEAARRGLTVEELEKALQKEAAK